MKLHTSYMASLALGLSCLLTEAASTTSSITATSSYKSYPLKVTESGGFHYETAESGTYTVKAVLPLPSDLKIDANCTLSFQVGDHISFSTSGSEPVSGSFASKTFTFKGYDYDSSKDKDILVSTVTISWNATSVTLSVNYTPIMDADALGLASMADFSNYDSDKNATVKFTNSESSFSFNVEKNGEQVVSINRPLIITGTDARTFKTLRDSTGESMPYESHVISATVTADMTPPTLVIQSPAAVSVVTNNDAITIKGTAFDAAGIFEVYAHIEGDEYGDEYSADISVGSSTISWTIEGFKPQVGSNILQIVATDMNGNETTLSRVVNYQQWTTLHVVTNGSGTISIAGMKNGKVLVGNRYQVTMTPAKGYALADWACYSDDSSLDNGDYYYGYDASDSFKVPSANNPVFKATFIRNPYANLKGSYTAISDENYVYSYLGYDGTEDNSTNLAMLTLTVTSNGVLSGKWNSRTKTASFTLSAHLHSYFSLEDMQGFSGNGWYDSQTNLVTFSSDKTSPRFGLTLDINDPSSFTGSYEDYDSGYEKFGYIHGYRNRATTTNSNAGTYNIGFLDTFDSGSGSTTRMGYSYATAVVSANGVVTLKYYPADGVTKAFSMTTAQGEDGSFIFFSPMYAKAGLLAGWLSVTNSAVSYVSFTNSDTGDSIMSELYWTKPTAKSGVYSSGFTNHLSAYGTLYATAKPRTNILDWSTGTLTLRSSTGETLASVDLAFAKNKFTIDANDSKISLTLTPGTGILSGSFINGKATAFTGLVIDSTRAVGFFTDTNAATGSFELNGASSEGSEK